MSNGAVRPPALFESFNAKRLTPAEIAASFVVPPYFGRLIGTDHVALIGPRGSGKTHLLRMLEGSALTAWEGRQAARYRKRIDYSAVFIPADRLWMAQIIATRGHSVIRSRLAVAAFVTHVLSRLVDTMLYRTHFFEDDPLHGVRLSSQEEADVADACSSGWQMELRGRSLVGLANALDARMSDVSRFVQLADEGVLDSPPHFAYLGLLDAVQLGINAFNRAARQRDHRWALLLDELELAPTEVHSQVVSALRAGSPTLLLKLSFSPFDHQAQFSRDLRAAAPDQDFRAVPLWYARRDESLLFSHALFDRMVAEAGLGPITPEQMLGTSLFDTSRRDWVTGSAYVKNSRQQRTIARHAQRDPVFRSYLAKKKINPDRLEDVPAGVRASTLRKVLPILVFREAFLTASGRRTRKKPVETFSGAGAVFGALEGNPRWLRAVITQLISRYQATAQVDRGYQYDALRESLRRFRALLGVLPPTYSTEDDSRRLFSVSQTADRSSSVIAILDRVAAYFSSNALGTFTPDPPGSFVVDPRVSPEVLASLRTALNAGAVVLVGSREQESLPAESLIGRRLRLTYLMAFDHRENPFPLRLGRAIDLSSILRQGTRGR